MAGWRSRAGYAIGPRSAALARAELERLSEDA